MQMAQQAAQVPAQAMQMAASVPQTLMLGVLSAVQQFSQLGGWGEVGEDPPAEDREVEAPEPSGEKEVPDRAAPSTSLRDGGDGTIGGAPVEPAPSDAQQVAANQRTAATRAMGLDSSSDV